MQDIDTRDEMKYNEIDVQKMYIMAYVQYGRHSREKVMEIKFECSALKKVKTGHLSIAEVCSDIELTSQYMTIDKKPVVPVMGEFHFSRYPSEMWEDEIKKMKAGGITIIAAYLFWIYHEEEEGIFDFHGDKDVGRFLELCQKNDMLVILRIGPWCHGEVVYGGFPEFIQKREDKRTSSPAYLEKVRAIYQAYYDQVKNYFYQNNSVLIGIQLENEYGGEDRDYIPKLRSMAVEIGFRLPLYTITAWPPNGSLKDNLLPLFGAYPERPWTCHTDPLPVDDRFHIVPEKIDRGIGADLLKNESWEELSYDDFMYAGCELGGGVQVCEHRRPIISSRDVYAISFIHLAQGVNMPGYYMYHGGRNQTGGEYQESRKTGYPNNCPISSYDFQAPISEYGYLRPSYYRLKLLHLFLKDFGESFALMQPFFCNEADHDLKYRVSVRMNAQGQGFVFINNYQRLTPFEAIEGLDIRIRTQSREIMIPDVSVPTDSSILFPVNWGSGSLAFEYITAQPICAERTDDAVKYYFFQPEGIACMYKRKDAGSAVCRLSPDDGESPVLTGRDGRQRVEIYLLTEKKAYELWKIKGTVLYSADTVMESGGGIELLKELPERDEILHEISLTEKAVEIHKHDDFLFSEHEGKEYELTVPENIFQRFEDVRLIFGFDGNVAQLYCGGELEADWFNYDGKWEIGLRRFRKAIEEKQRIIIRISPLDKERDIYFEHDMARDTAKLALKGCVPIIRFKQPVIQF